MKLCLDCLDNHPGLWTKLGTYDVGMCEDCLKIKLVYPTHEIMLYPEPTPTAESELPHGIEVVSQNEEWLREVALSQYVGQTCVYCSQVFTTVKSLVSAVWAVGGIAHKGCWKEHSE